MKRRIAHALAAIAIAATVALGCGWPVGSERSVRFNWDKASAADFARLEPLRRAPELSYEETEARDRRLMHTWGAVMGAQESGDLLAVRRHLREYLELSETVVDEGVQKLRNSAIDRLDALTALDQGAPHDVVSSYLAARDVYDEKGTAWGEIMLGRLAPDARLADNYAYLRAAVEYRDLGYELAAEQFEELVRRYPRSEKREAAVYMAALSNIRAALPGEYSAYPDERYVASSDRGAAIEARESATRAFKRIAANPKGRYAVDARGWIAHLEWHRGDRAEALAEYFRLVADPSNAPAYRLGLSSLRIVRPKATAEELARLEHILAREPRVGLAYAYYELYNFGPWLGNGSYYGDEQEAERARREQGEAFTRIVDFATRMASHAPKGAAGGAFLTRAAMANLELGRDDDAARLARRALASGLRGEERTRSLWVAACADFHLGAHAEARRGFETLVAEAPDDPLAEGARCHLAMIAEDEGDLAGALGHYLELGYELDVAYLVDVLMTPEQLADFLAKNPSHKERDALWYALGLRYLRAGDLERARVAYTNVRTIAGTEDDDYPWGWYYDDSRYVPKSPFGIRYDVKGVRARWVAHDLQTLADLEYLRSRVDEAADDEGRAEALYQLASYLYEGSCLLFYNPNAWGGSRAGMLSETRSSWLRLPGEDAAVWAHAQEHEPVAQALRIYLEIVDRYPNTRAARDALLTAKFCDDRLVAYNAYWGTSYAIGRHAGQRRVTGATLKTEYPDYAWPPYAGFQTWEPSTRTVDGMPAWPEPPKPKPPKPLWRRAADRGLLLLVSVYMWIYEAVTGFVTRTIAFHVDVTRFGLLVMTLLVSVYAGLRAWRSAIPVAGRRPSHLAAWLLVRAARDGVVESRGALVRTSEAGWRIAARGSLLSADDPANAPDLDRAERFWDWLGRTRSIVLHTRTGLALLLYGLPASLLAFLLLALASRF